MNLKTQLNKITSHQFQFPNQFHLQSNNLGGKILELYIITIFIISQLYLLDITIPGISIKTVLFLIITLMTTVVYLNLIAKRRVTAIKFKSSFKRCVLYILLFNMLSLFLKLFSNDYSQVLNFEWEVLIVVLILSYFLIAGNVRSYRYYLLLLLTIASLVYAGLLYHYLADSKWIGPMEYLLQSPERIAVYLVLMTTVSSLLYCTSKEKTESTFTLLLSGIGYFLLFVTNNIISLCIVAILFFIIPIVFLPKAELIKRNLHLFFLYFFLLSNMALVTNYFNWVQVEVKYDIEVSIYIDLFLSVVAIICFNYSEKVPKGIELRRILLWKIQRIYGSIFYFVGFLFLTIFLAGDKMTQLSDKCGLDQIPGFVSKFQQYYTNNNGTLFDVLAEFGWIGFILLLLLVITIMGQLKKSYCKQNDMSTILIVIAIIYLLQSLFFSQQLVTTPIYIILLTLALNLVPRKKGEK